MGNILSFDKLKPLELPPTNTTNLLKPMPIGQDNTPKYSNFEEKILAMHNLAREKNGLEPLVWDKALQQRARDWNQFLSQQDGGIAICRNMRHPGTGPDASEEEIGRFLPQGNGQNLYQSNAVQMIDNQWVPFDSSSPQEAVRKWYDECNMWKMPPPGQAVPDKFLEVGHMTQLLWKDTRKVGCSSIQCRDTNRVHGKDVESKGQIITCHYDRGNVAGEFQTQVPNRIFCQAKNEWLEVS